MVTHPVREAGPDVGAGPGEAVAVDEGAVVDEGAAVDEVGVVVAPAKVIRLTSMVEAIVEEMHSQPFDQTSRARIRGMYRDALVEVGSALSDPLLDELARLQPGARLSSDDELRVDIALLSGWLRGLRFGLAAAAVPFTLRDED